MTLTIEATQAVEKILSDRGIRHGGAEREVGWAQSFAGWGRAAIARGADVQSERLQLAEAILAAAGVSAVVEEEHHAPLARTSQSANPQLSPAQADGDQALLGIDAAGRAMSVAVCRAAGAAPLEYLTSPGAVLTAEGKAVLRRLQDSPTARAASLAIDVNAVAAYAQKAGIDPAACLAAEIERIDQLEADKRVLAGLPLEGAPAGSVPGKPIDPLLEHDREMAKRFGLDL